MCSEMFCEGLKAEDMNAFHKFVRKEIDHISKYYLCVAMKQIIDSMNEDQQYVLFYLVNEASNRKE